MTTAYVTKPGFDLQMLRPHGVGDVKYFTDGYSTELPPLQEKIAELLEAKHPEDVIVPTGSAVHNFLVGFMLGQRKSSVRILVYYKGSYIPYHVDADPTNTYEEVENGNI